jgi:hypothetical protein
MWVSLSIATLSLFLSSFATKVTSHISQIIIVIYYLNKYLALASAAAARSDFRLERRCSLRACSYLVI